MINMDRSKWALRPMRLMGVALASMALASTGWIATAEAVPCPRNDALGTSRVMAVDAATTPRVGIKVFPQTLPLQDHEVVLTFDDGPWPPTTPKVLAALAQECVQATFFLIGKPASEHPDLVRRIAAGGHTIGTHSWTHANLGQIKPDDAVDQIDRGVSAVEAALRSNGGTAQLAPFFRFPYFESTPATLDLLQSRGIMVFGADLWASDWNPMTPKQELKILADRLNAAHKGIILLHDPKGHTAAMLPAFLRYLRENHYHVVHLVPVGSKAEAAKAERATTDSAKAEAIR
jgi:peptidoglycan/xylan/chitin deacetylase (PgdA/CDA1 family)